MTAVHNPLLSDIISATSELTMEQGGATSMVRQNYSLEAEAAINKMINIELHNSYVYTSMV